MAGKDIGSRFPRCFAGAQIPDPLCCSTREMKAGQGRGGKIDKK